MRPAHRHAVLLVDDYDDFREGIVMLLDAAGLEVRGASSGPDALAVLAAGFQPCLILLDLHMPGMDGWQMWEALQQRPATADMPVIFLSGNTSVVRRHAAGIAGLLAKPCDERNLVAAVNAHARCPMGDATKQAEALSGPHCLSTRQELSESQRIADTPRRFGAMDDRCALCDAPLAAIAVIRSDAQGRPSQVLCDRCGFLPAEERERRRDEAAYGKHADGE